MNLQDGVRLDGGGVDGWPESAFRAPRAAAEHCPLRRYGYWLAAARHRSHGNPHRAFRPSSGCSSCEAWKSSCRPVDCVEGCNENASSREIHRRYMWSNGPSTTNLEHLGKMTWIEGGKQLQHELRDHLAVAHCGLRSQAAKCGCALWIRVHFSALCRNHEGHDAGASSWRGSAIMG